MRTKWRFFYHYNKRNDRLTVHFMRRCIVAKNIDCRVNTESKWNNKQQPRLVIQGWARDLIVEGDNITIV